MQFRKALIIRFGGMGDIILATPTVRALRRAFPGITIDMVVGGGMAPAIEGHPDIRRVLTFDKRGADAKPLRFAVFLAGLAREGYDLVLNLHPSVKSYLMAVAAHPKRHVVFQKQMLDSDGRTVHAIDDFTKELRSLGIASVQDRALDFSVSDRDHDRLDAILEECGVLPGDRLVVINPAATRPINRWPQQRFAAVASHFASLSGVRVLVTGAPSSFRSIMDGLDEVALAAQVASVDPKIVDISGRLTVKQYGALLQRASVFLTCDTGPMHIAAALGTPMVVLSGAADPDRTGPIGPNATILMDRTVQCAPCRDRICRRGDVLCMDNHTVDYVIEAVTARMTARRKAHGFLELRTVN